MDGQLTDTTVTIGIGSLSLSNDGPTDRDPADPVRASGDSKVAIVDPEMLVKHPLENVWSLWYFKNDKKRTWAENLRVIATFDTVEDFWAYVHRWDTVLNWTVSVEISS